MDAPTELPSDSSQPSPAAKDPLSELEEVVRQIRVSALNIALAVVDATRIRLRSMILRFIAACAAATFVALLAIVGVVLFMIGASRGVAVLFGFPDWGGYLSVGLLSFVVLALAGTISRRVMDRRWFEATRSRIAARHTNNEEQT